jgi:hypothetical protein
MSRAKISVQNFLSIRQIKHALFVSIDTLEAQTL